MSLIFLKDDQSRHGWMWF